MSNAPPTLALDGTETLVAALVVLYLGKLVVEHSRLREQAVPSAVVGGFLVSIVLTVLFVAGVAEVSFETAVRDRLLLVFFATVGLAARWSLLRLWLKPIVVLLALATALTVLQDVVGSAIVALIGGHPVYGLATGGISMMGGPGTAIAWVGA